MSEALNSFVFKNGATLIGTDKQSIIFPPDDMVTAFKDPNKDEYMITSLEDPKRKVKVPGSIWKAVSSSRK